MAILYGTQSNGETLPVLVDQFGNLIAKGIEGQQGPPGPPGVGELPPDPIEGALLGWEDGELAWVGGSVPLPENTYGPLIYKAAEGLLEIPQDASALVNGQQLFMSDKNGNLIVVMVETDIIANVSGSDQEGYILTFPSDKDFDKLRVGDVVQNASITFIDIVGKKITVDGGSWLGADGSGDQGDGRYEPSQEWSTRFDTNPNNPERAFNGDVVSQEMAGNINSPISWNSPFLINGDVTIWTRSNTSQSNTIVVSLMDAENNAPVASKTLENVDHNSATAVTFTGVVGAKFVKVSMTKGSSQRASYIGGIKIGGQLLVDKSVPGSKGETHINEEKGGEGSVFSGLNEAIVLRSDNKKWIDGYYATAPQQRIAARKVAASAIRRKTK